MSMTRSSTEATVRTSIVTPLSRFGYAVSARRTAPPGYVPQPGLPQARGIRARRRPWGKRDEYGCEVNRKEDELTQRTVSRDIGNPPCAARVSTARPTPGPDQFRKSVSMPRQQACASSAPRAPASPPAAPAGREFHRDRCAAVASTFDQTGIRGAVNLDRPPAPRRATSSAGFMIRCEKPRRPASRIVVAGRARRSRSISSQAARVPDTTMLPGTEQLAMRIFPTARCACAQLLDRCCVQAEDADHAARRGIGRRPASPRRAACTTQAVAKLMAPAKTRAVYSPRLNPAVASHAAIGRRVASVQRLPARPGWRRRWPAG